MDATLNLKNISLDSLTDSAILAHGFMPYKRDYFFEIETLWQPKGYAGQYRVIFRHCYDLKYKTKLKEAGLLESWEDHFIDYKTWEESGEPTGYLWGTNWANAYPGFAEIKNSSTANEWTTKLGKEMKELQVESEIFTINLIYFNWTIEKLNDETGLISKVLFPL